MYLQKFQNIKPYFLMHKVYVHEVWSCNTCIICYFTLIDSFKVSQVFRHNGTVVNIILYSVQL